MEESGFDSPIWLLCTQLVILAFVAVGGGFAMLLPELQRFVVEEHHWMTNEDFIAAFTLGQAAPGPNFLYLILIGYHLAGAMGAAMAMTAVLLPSSLMAYALLRFGLERVSPRLQKAMREGLAPVSGGMVLAFGWILCSHVDTNWRAALVTLVTVVIVMRSKINPVWLVLAGAGLGLGGVVLD